MERLLMRDLMAWKDKPARKPLLLRGARQTGKTWLVEEFGRRCFDDVVKVDFLLDGRAQALFEPDLDPKRIISQVELRCGRSIDPEHTLLFFDEIQEAPQGITALKYFCELAREYHVVASSSYMGIKMRRENESFPVGKVDEMIMRPLCFEEFVRALKGDLLADALQVADMDTLAPMNDVLVDYLGRFLVIGGMPEPVSCFAKSGDYAQVRCLQLEILDAYDADFGKHAPARILERMRMVWHSLPSQLARENKKFVYGAVRSGGRARDFEESIQWLVDYGVVNQVNRVNALRVPLASYGDTAAFKLFCVDVGLLGAQAGLEASAVLKGSDLFTEFKGALIEQYVCQELLHAGHRPVYWSSDTGMAETDFSVANAGRVLPIEVKAGENLKAKSLKVACEKFGLERAIRTSLSGYRDEGRLVNIPLWAIASLSKFA